MRKNTKVHIQHTQKHQNDTETMADKCIFFSKRGTVKNIQEATSTFIPSFIFFGFLL